MKSSIYIRKRIISLREKSPKITLSQIQKILRFDENFMISINSIFRVIKALKSENRIGDAKRSGRKRKLNSDEIDFVSKEIEMNREIGSDTIQQHLLSKFNKKVSIDTITRVAKLRNWSKKGTRYCQIVSPANQIKRLLFAHFCLQFNEDFIFVDESMIELHVHKLIRWRKKGDRNFKVGVLKHPLRFLVVAGISEKGASPICIFNGIMDSEDFCNILRRNLVRFIRENFPDGHRLIMDNDRKHTSTYTKTFLNKSNVHHWPTPPQSPDLNPIELVWHELKENIRSNKPQSKSEFLDAIGNFWSKVMTPEKCREYIRHARQVLSHVVLRGGQATGF